MGTESEEIACPQQTDAESSAGAPSQSPLHVSSPLRYAGAARPPRVPYFDRQKRTRRILGAACIVAWVGSALFILWGYVRTMVYLWHGSHR